MQTTVEHDPKQGTPVQVRLHKPLLDAIESWRREQQSIPSRPEAIRRLLYGALSPQTETGGYRNSVDVR
jgi:hypothetical protein